MLDALVEHWARGGRPRAAGDGALPAGDRRRRRRRRGRRASASSPAGRGRVRRRHADPRRRRGSRRGAALRLPDGDLPHLHRRASAPEKCGTCGPGRSTGKREKWSEPASTRRKATLQSPYEKTGTPDEHDCTATDRHPYREPARAPLRGAARRAGARVRRDPRPGHGRARRPRPPLHREHDRDAAAPGGARPRAAARLPQPRRLGGRDHRALARRRSSRTWRSATTSCTASGTG